MHGFFPSSSSVVIFIGSTSIKRVFFKMHLQKQSFMESRERKNCAYVLGCLWHVTEVVSYMFLSAQSVLVLLLRLLVQFFR